MLVKRSQHPAQLCRNVRVPNIVNRMLQFVAKTRIVREPRDKLVELIVDSILSCQRRRPQDGREVPISSHQHTLSRPAD